MLIEVSKEFFYVNIDHLDIIHSTPQGEWPNYISDFETRQGKLVGQARDRQGAPGFTETTYFYTEEYLNKYCGGVPCQTN